MVKSYCVKQKKPGLIVSQDSARYSARLIMVELMMKCTCSECGITKIHNS